MITGYIIGLPVVRSQDFFPGPIFKKFSGSLFGNPNPRTDLVYLNKEKVVVKQVANKQPSNMQVENIQAKAF